MKLIFVDVTTEVLDEHGRVIKKCEEDIAVNKCEGNCVSKVQPSVNTPSGFLKVRTYLMPCIS